MDPAQFDSTTANAIARAVLEAQNAAVPVWYLRFSFWVDFFSLIGLALTLQALRLASKARSRYLRKHRLPTLSEELSSQLDSLVEITLKEPLPVDDAKEVVGQIRETLIAVAKHGGLRERVRIWNTLRHMKKPKNIKGITEAQNARHIGRGFERSLQTLIQDEQEGAL
jgi:hypothetical protein